VLAAPSSAGERARRRQDRSAPWAFYIKKRKQQQLEERRITGKVLETGS